MTCKLFEQIDLINKIRTARGDDFTEGFLVAINLAAIIKNEESEEKPSK